MKNYFYGAVTVTAKSLLVANYATITGIFVAMITIAVKSYFEMKRTF